MLVETFYHVVYRGSAATGNCYGMSLEALRTHRGIGLWSAPLSGVGPPGGGLVDEDAFEPWIARRSNRSQGTRLSGAMTFHLLRSLVNGSIVRAGTVFDEVAATPGLLRLPVLDGGDDELYARTGRFPDEFSHAVRPTGVGGFRESVDVVAAFCESCACCRGLDGMSCHVRRDACGRSQSGWQPSSSPASCCSNP